MRTLESIGARLPPAGRYHAAPAPAQASMRTCLPALAPAYDTKSTEAPRTRPQAAFLAQLVATAENLPVARARRRADPAVVISRYEAVAALKPTIR
jgi:hypothetical protein